MKRLIFALCLLASPALASNCPTYPFTLTNGQTADANQVMANFNSILNCANNSLTTGGANSNITALTGLTTPISIPQGGTGATSAIDALSTLGAASIISPNFTGSPTATTPATADSSIRLATTAYVQAQGYAPLASPTFTGLPAADTAAGGTNTTQLATTAFANASASSAVSTAIAALSAASGGEITLSLGTARVKLFTVTYTPSTSHPTHNISFAVPFPNHCYGAVATDSVTINGSPLGNTGGVPIVGTGSLSTSGMVIGEDSNTGANFSGSHTISVVAWGD